MKNQRARAALDCKYLYFYKNKQLHPQYCAIIDVRSTTVPADNDGPLWDHFNYIYQHAPCDAERHAGGKVCQLRAISGLFYSGALLGQQYVRGVLPRPLGGNLCIKQRNHPTTAEWRTF